MKSVIWFTGLSGSGKSTLARKLAYHCNLQNLSSVYLDGDDLRGGVSKDLGFSHHDRVENIRRIAELSLVLCKQVDIVIVATISPTNDLRELARQIIGKRIFKLVYLSTSLNVCIKRDPKGLYKKARRGIIKSFTGISSPFDSPSSYDLEIDTNQLTIKESITKISSFLKLQSERKN